MKTMKPNSKRMVVCLAAVAAGIIAVGLIVRPLLAQQTNGVTIVQTSSNQIQLTLTNTTVGETYVIYRRQMLGDPNDPWRFHLLGAPSQTVFTVTMGIEDFMFFQSISGTNWDGDAAPNWTDANPVDPNIGVLSVTID